MWILITIFILFFSSIIYANVYYCVEEESIGFIPPENFRQANYTKEKYTIEIDFEKLTIDSMDVGMPKGSASCRKYHFYENVMQCSSFLGGRDFTLNLNTMIFSYTTTYLTNEMEDSLNLSWGKCQKF